MSYLTEPLHSSLNKKDFIVTKSYLTIIYKLGQNKILNEGFRLALFLQATGITKKDTTHFRVLPFGGNYDLKRL